MNESIFANVTTTQRRRIYANIPMNVFYNINILMVQLGTSCVFDSPGLARNEPTPGKHSQGDSTPSVLSFFWEGMVITRVLIGCYANIPMNIFCNINILMVQRRRCYINLLMNVFAFMNVSNPQQCWYCDIFSMRVLYIINALVAQLGTSCSFDSPGLARNEPTPGEYSQGDSTL